MTISSPNWPWYVAEYVISETRDNKLAGYAIHSYLVRANNAELAYAKAILLQSSLGDATHDSQGRVVEYRCLGMHNLDTLQSEGLSNGQHLSVITWSATPVPRIREKHELRLFS
jgi:hypothetical protein